MVSQAKVDGPSRRVASDPHPAQHGKGLAHDAIELFELQAALLGADLRRAIKAGRIGGVLVMIAGALLFAAGPVLLFALASWIETAFELARPLSLAVAGCAGAAVGFAALLTGWRIASRGANSLSRSRDECLRNVAWFKEMLAHKSDRRD